MAITEHFRVPTVVAAILIASVLVGIATVEPAEAAFPGKNGKIAFVSNRDGDAEIYTMSLTGNNLNRLTNNSRADSDPSWSADGKKIVFARGGRLYTMSADGSNLKRVPNSLGDYEPAFSPSGRKLVFGRCDSIYTMNVDGSNLKKFDGEGCSVYYSDREFADSQPEWSADGRKIVFERLGGHPWLQRIFVKRVADSSLKQVFEDDEDNFYYPSFSPDGSQITYTCVCSEDPFTADYNSDIYRVNMDGSGDTRLTTDPARDFQSAFSPNGDKVIFTSNRDGDSDLYIMNADGTGVTQLTNHPAADNSPDWQPVQ